MQAATPMRPKPGRETPQGGKPSVRLLRGGSVAGAFGKEDAHALFEKAKRMVDAANAHRGEGKLDFALENRFSIRTVNPFGDLDFRVFRVYVDSEGGKCVGVTLNKPLQLVPLKDAELDPISPCFSMDALRERSPLAEGIRS
jgi:hypothetical protein